MISQYWWVFWEVLTAEHLELGATVLTGWNIAIFYIWTPYLRNCTVLYYWSSPRCIKSWIVVCCRGLKFPHRAVVLLVLERDGACSGLNGRSARTSAVLVLVWCYIVRGEREQDLWRCWLPEGCIKQQCDRASGYGCCSKKCEQGEQWNSDLAVSRTLSKHSDIEWNHKIWDITFNTTRPIFPVI